MLKLKFPMSVMLTYFQLSLVRVLASASKKIWPFCLDDLYKPKHCQYLFLRENSSEITKRSILDVAAVLDPPLEITSEHFK